MISFDSILYESAHERLSSWPAFRDCVCLWLKFGPVILVIMYHDLIEYDIVFDIIHR